MSCHPVDQVVFTPSLKDQAIDRAGYYLKLKMKNQDNS